MTLLKDVSVSFKSRVCLFSSEQIWLFHLSQEQQRDLCKQGGYEFIHS